MSDIFSDYLLRHSFNKEVLHLGVLGDIDRYISVGFDGWIFKDISRTASKAIGIDINRDAVKKANTYGFKNVIYGDAQDFDLRKKFDIIFAGDLIEHLTNFEGFFKSCKKHMHKNSLLVITTPNPFSFNNFLRVFLFGKPSIFPEHTCYITDKNFEEIARRFGFSIKESGFYTAIDKRNLWYHLLSVLLVAISTIRKRYNLAYYILLKIK